MVDVEAARLANAEAGFVEQLEQRAVPEPERALLPWHRQHCEHLVDRKNAWKPGGKLRAADGPGGVGGDATGGDQMAVEGTDRRQSAGAAPRSVVDRQRPEPSADRPVVGGGQIPAGTPEVADEGADVPEVRLHRVRRAAPGVG